MILKAVLLSIYLVFICISDARERKIKNKHTIVLLLTGLLIGVMEKQMVSCLIGMALPLMLFPLFALRMLGAGDIKAFCAIGALVGWKLSLYTMAFSFISGGIMAICIMIVQANGTKRIRYFFNYLRSCFLTKKIQGYGFGGNQNSWFRFSYAICTGTVLMFVNEITHFIM